MRITWLGGLLTALLLVGGAAQGGVPCPITDPALATPCPNPRPTSPIDLQLIIEPNAKGLGPLRGGQALRLIAYVASRLSIRTNVGFFVSGRPVGQQTLDIRANCPPEGPICILGTQSVQTLWTAEPGPHTVTARLLTLSRSLAVNILGPALQEGSDFAPAELLVRFKPEATPPQIQEILQRLGTQAIQLFSLTQIYHLSILDGSPVSAKVAQFQRESLVEFAEPNGHWHFQQQPNDPLFRYQWNLHNTGQEHPSADKFLIFGGTAKGTAGADVGALRAWAQTTDSSSLVIALLDSGVFLEQPDLSPNLFLSGARDFARGDDLPDDLFGHGTFVAGIIAAVGNNDQELAGLSWRAKLWPLKLSEEPRFSWSVLLAALEHTIVHKRAGLAVRIINFSAGGSERSQSVQTALDLVSQEGLLLVTAAGNYGKDLEREPFYPCSYPHEIVLCVSASTSRDELTGWSSWGARTVDLAAPGEDILGLLIEKPDNFLRLPRTRALPELSPWLAVAGGTSYATAHATGLAALLWALCPAKNALEVRNLLLSAVEKKSSFAGKVSSGGRLRWPGNLAC